jgi:PAS domain S-box-containing protein
MTGTSQCPNADVSFVTPIAFRRAQRIWLEWQMSEAGVFDRSEGSMRLPILCGAFAATVGVLVLLGWSLGIRALTSILPGYIAMNPATATCLTLAGTALILCQRRPAAARLLAGAIVTIGALKLLQLIIGAPMGVDQILFAHAVEGAASATPNRMAPNTALALSLLGGSLLVTTASRGRSLLLSQLLAGATAAIALFALIGYILGIGHLYGVRSFIPMALHTAVSLLVLAVGVLGVREEGLAAVLRDRGPAGTLARTVLPLSVFVPVLVGVLRLAGQRAGWYGTEVGIALQVMANVLFTFALLTGSVFALFRTDRLRRRRESAVARSEEQYRLAETVAHVGHWRMDAATRDLFWSAEMFRIADLQGGRPPRPEEVLDLYHPEDRPEARKCLVRALKTGEGWDQTFRLCRGNDTRWVKSHGVAEQDDEGNVRAVFGVFADVTDLEDARQRAEQATEEKAAFLANMSHEIRTPLNSIIGFTDLLLEEASLSPQQKRQLNLIQNAGSALLTVVNDILDFSKIGAGKITIESQPFAIETMVDNTVSIVHATAEAKGLPILVRIAPDVARHHQGDEVRLRQILLNFLNNAVKFTNSGSISVDVGAQPHEDNAQRLRFAVRDTGVGIPKDKQDRLFQQFSQADASISREYGGTGLGLAISKSLAELMGGRIGLDSEEGQGSTFWFEVDLPISREPSRVEEASRPSVSVGSADILLVEDLPMNQELACALLSRAGHRVDVANHGGEAIEAVKRKRYDLLLMDIQMPKVDGITATKAIRAMEGDAGQVPIIAMTANVLPEQVREFRRVGMNDHVAKPIKQADLHAAIARIMQQGAATASEPAAEDAITPEFDEETFGKIVQLFPPARLKAHLASFDTQLATVFDGSMEREELKAAAHKLITQAGMLGFMRLSDSARKVEEAAETNAPLDYVLDEARDLSTRARARIVNFL